MHRIEDCNVQRLRLCRDTLYRGLQSIKVRLSIEIQIKERYWSYRSLSKILFHLAVNRYPFPYQSEKKKSGKLKRKISSNTLHSALKCTIRSKKNHIFERLSGILKSNVLISDKFYLATIVLLTRKRVDLHLYRVEIRFNDTNRCSLFRTDKAPFNHPIRRSRLRNPRVNVFRNDF